MIVFTRQDNADFVYDPAFYEVWLDTAAYLEGFEVGNLDYVFVTDDELLEMNKTYLDHDYYTDIITFDYTEGNVLAGDMFISTDRVKENAVEFGVSFEKELMRVCVHGLLHLCGYGDKTDNEINLMREKEDFYINRYVSRET
jgi:probable rRNA maturation factor